MIKEFMLPELGENIQAADVLSVFVKKGDVIRHDQLVLEIETDKATIEVPSSIGGRIVEVFIKPGEKVSVGQVVFNLESDVDAPQEAEPEPAVPLHIPENEPKPAPAPVSASNVLEMQLPELGENITSADVLKVLIKPGDTVKIDDVVLEIETDKATIEVPSAVSGVVTEIFVEEGKKATVGQVIFKATSTEAWSAAPVSVAPAAPENTAKPEEEKPVPVIVEPVQPAPEKPSLIDNQPAILSNSAPAAPSVRRLARELGVNINNIPGSGANGRISLDDVKSYVKSLNLEQRQPAGGQAVGIRQEALPDFSKFGEVERSTMSNVRAKTADHLSYAWATIPHVTQFDKADITELETLRKQFAPNVEKSGGKLTVTAILIKVIASALKVFPQFNASVDMEKKEIIYKKYFNIGVAVDTERGLIVPVLNNVDKKNISQIAADLNVISEKARARKISPDDLQGGCFTISNLGGIGGTYFTPIVNAPEAAILGVSRGAYEQVYKNGFFLPRLMLPLSLSYDHRIIDGADAIRFLRWVIDALEQPMKILIEG